MVINLDEELMRHIQSPKSETLTVSHAYTHKVPVSDILSTSARPPTTPSPVIAQQQSSSAGLANCGSTKGIALPMRGYSLL